MALTALPNQGDLVTPIDWQGKTQQTSFQAAGYTLRGTIGWRPYTESATLTFVVKATTAASLLSGFKLQNFNGAYTYTCPVRGSIKIRLTGDYNLSESRDPNGQRIHLLSIGVETI